MSEQSDHITAASSVPSARLGHRGKTLAAALGITLTLGACQSTREVAPVEPVYGGPPVEEVSVDQGPTPEPQADMGGDADMASGSQGTISAEDVPAPAYGGPPVDEQPVLVPEEDVP